MLGKDKFNEIKQTNISKDAEKTKQRVRELWKETQKAQRDEILDLSGLKKFTVERTYKNGNISVRLAVALAQVSHSNPYYFTGEADERSEFSDELLIRFLTENGYGKFFEPGEVKKKRNYRKKTVDNTDKLIIPPVEEPEAAPAVGEEETVASIPEQQNALYEMLTSRVKDKVQAIKAENIQILETMPYEKAEELLKGLLLRSEYSEEAKNLATIVKLIMTL